MNSYPEILQALKYLNNQNQIMKKHWKNVITKAKLQYIQPNFQQNNARKRTQKIIWFNPPFSWNVKTNMAKMFLQLIDTNFPPTNKLHKIFNSNTVKVSYSCTQNISQIIKGHNKKVTQIRRHHQLECNCLLNTEFPLNCDCFKEDVMKSVSWRCRGWV